MAGRVVIETVFTSFPQFGAAFTVLVLAYAVYVLFGFGSGLIAVALMASFMPEIKDVVVMLLLLGLPVELFVVSKSWRQVNWKGVAVICIGVVCGVPLGGRILQHGEPTVVLTFLGLFLVLAGLGFLFIKAKSGFSWPVWSGPPVGLLAGLLGGLFGTGGPPLIFYYRLAGVEKAVFRGSLMGIFLVTGLIRLPDYALEGLITQPRLLGALALAPAALLGAFIGNKVHFELSEQRFKQIVSVGLCAIGLLLLIG